jgi:hypothetical protein
VPTYETNTVTPAAIKAASPPMAFVDNEVYINTSKGWVNLRGPQGIQGPKGDPGGLSVSKTLNWNTATAPGFYRSTNDGVEQTINGPGDALNPPRTVGVVQLHENGAIVQRVWDLDTQRGFTRYRASDGVTWTAWATDLTKPPVWTDAGVSMVTPEDGDERYFQNAAMKDAGILWKFRYDKTAPSGKPKWLFAGGQGFYDINDSDTFYGGAPNTWGDAGPVGPGFVAPLQGDYTVEFGGLLYANAPGIYVAITVSVNGVPDVNHSVYHGNFGAGYVDYGDQARTNRYDNVLSGQMMKLAYYSNPIGGGFQKRWMRVTPIRVVM